MFGCYVWCVLRSSREPYRDIPIERADKAELKVDAADKKLWSDFKRLMQELYGEEAPAGSRQGATWSFHEEYIHERGVLLFFDSCNHRTSHFVEDVLPWIATNGPGSFGICYVWDDEDLGGENGRTRNDYSCVFRVYRLANGALSEHDDPFLSPIVPTIAPSEYWR